MHVQIGNFAVLSCSLLIPRGSGWEANTEMCVPLARWQPSQEETLVALMALPGKEAASKDLFDTWDENDFLRFIQANSDWASF